MHLQEEPTLWEAVKSGDVDAVEALLDEGFHPDDVEEGREITPILDAHFLGFKDVLDLMLKFKGEKATLPTEDLIKSIVNVRLKWLPCCISLIVLLLLCLTTKSKNILLFPLLSIFVADVVCTKRRVLSAFFFYFKHQGVRDPDEGGVRGGGMRDVRARARSASAAGHPHAACHYHRPYGPLAHPLYNVHNRHGWEATVGTERHQEIPKRT